MAGFFKTLGKAIDRLTDKPSPVGAFNMFLLAVVFLVIGASIGIMLAASLFWLIETFGHWFWTGLATIIGSYVGWNITSEFRAVKAEQDGNQPS